MNTIDFPFNYGKHKATSDNRDLLYADFRRALLRTGKLPKFPDLYGHANDYIGSAWKMLGNGPDDTVFTGFEGCGDCAWAGPAHEIMEINQNAGKPEPLFNGDIVVRQYEDYSHYNRHTGENDNGSNVRDVLEWRRTKGFQDAKGGIHKIGMYVALEPQNVYHLLEATYLFECVGIGFEVPGSAEQQFMEAESRGDTPKWEYVGSSEIVGGHYVPIMGHPAPNETALVSWARRVIMGFSFYEHYNDEAWAYVTPEAINRVTGKSYEGYNPAQLEEYLHLV